MANFTSATARLAEQAGLEDWQLAKILGVHLRTVHRWFYDEVTTIPPYVGLVLRLIIEYKLRTDDLISFSEEGKIHDGQGQHG